MPSNRFLAAGSFGCVYEPAFPCAGQPSSDGNTDTVSKIFAKGSTMHANRLDFEEEVEKNKMARTINAEENFALTHVNHCDVNSAVLNNPEKSACASSYPLTRQNTLDNFAQGRLPQIIYKNGGIPLKDLWDKHVPLIDFLVHFQNIMHGLVKLNQHKHAHVDIKPLNVLYKPSTQRVSLIDFGLLGHQDWIYTQSMMNYSYLMHFYAYYPPEFKVLFQFFAPHFLSKNPSLRKHVDSVYLKPLDRAAPKDLDISFHSWPPFRILFSRYNPEKNRDLAQHFRTVDESVALLKPHLQQKFKRVLKRFLYTTRARQIDTFRSTLRSRLNFTDFSFSQSKFLQMESHFRQEQFGAKIDLYSIGMTLLEVINRYLTSAIFGQHVHDSQVLSEADLEYIISLLLIISGMVHPDPYQRLGAHEAAFVYDKLVEAIQTTDVSTKQVLLNTIEQSIRDRFPHDRNANANANAGPSTGPQSTSASQRSNTTASTTPPSRRSSAGASATQAPVPSPPNVSMRTVSRNASARNASSTGPVPMNTSPSLSVLRSNDSATLQRGQAYSTKKKGKN